FHADYNQHILLLFVFFFHDPAPPQIYTLSLHDALPIYAAIPGVSGPQCGVSLAGFLCFCWLKQEEDEEELTTVQKHSRAGYNIAALLFLFLFLDNLLRRAEGQAWKGFWSCSWRCEVVVLFVMLSL